MIRGCKHTRAAPIASKRPRATQANGEPNQEKLLEKSRKLLEQNTLEREAKHCLHGYLSLRCRTCHSNPLRILNNNNKNFIDFVFDMKISVPKNNQYNYKWNKVK